MTKNRKSRLRREEREKAVKTKLAELRKLREQRVEVDKSIWELKKYYGELNKQIVEVRGEIRLLGGKAPIGTEYDERLMLWHLRDEGRLSDERP